MVGRLLVFSLNLKNKKAVSVLESSWSWLWRIAVQGEALHSPLHSLQQVTSCWALGFISCRREPVLVPCRSYCHLFLQNFFKGGDSSFIENTLIHISLPLIPHPVQDPRLFRMPQLTLAIQVSPRQVMQQPGQERKFRRGIPLLSGWQLGPPGCPGPFNSHTEAVWVTDSSSSAHLVVTI